MTPIFWLLLIAVGVYVLGIFVVVDHFAKKLTDLHGDPEWTTTEPERRRQLEAASGVQVRILYHQPRKRA